MDDLTKAIELIEQNKKEREAKAMDYIQKAIEHVEKEYNVIVFITPPQTPLLTVKAKQ